MNSVEIWDEWFEATGDVDTLRIWTAVKSVHDDPDVLNGWASIIEMNRLSALEEVGKVKENTPHDAVS